MKLLPGRDFWICSHRHIRSRLACLPKKKKESTLRKITAVRFAHYSGLYATALIVVLIIISQGADGLRDNNQPPLGIDGVFANLQVFCSLIVAIVLPVILRSISFIAATLFGVPLSLMLFGMGYIVSDRQALGERMAYFASSLFVWIGICIPAFISFAILKEKIISKAITSE